MYTAQRVKCRLHEIKHDHNPCTALLQGAWSLKAFTSKAILSSYRGHSWWQAESGMEQGTEKSRDERSHFREMAYARAKQRRQVDCQSHARGRMSLLTIGPQASMSAPGLNEGLSSERVNLRPCRVGWPRIAHSPLI
jgi:hypothetical protein